MMNGRPLLILSLVLASCSRPPAAHDTALTETTFPSSVSPDRAQPTPTGINAVRRPDTTLIRAGRLPLVHMFEQGGQVRIVDATTNKMLLATTAPAHSIISVSDSGILVARERKMTTRLDPAHRYEIWWDTPGGG